MYDIYAYDENKREIAHLRAATGTFRRINEHGYDWFKLINASECDGGVSGMGVEKKIKLFNFLKAMKKLKSHKVKRELVKIHDDTKDGTTVLVDYWTSRKRKLRKFMRKCINWCILNNKDEILIGFY